MKTYQPAQYPTQPLPSAANAATGAIPQSPEPGSRSGRWQLPQANGPFWLLTAFTLGCALVLWRPPPGLPTLQPVAAPQCPVPVEVPGLGVRCLAAAEAQRLGLSAGAVWPLGPQGERAVGPPVRMAPRRLLAAQVLLDPETASAAELEALPDVGPHLARRIVEARAAPGRPAQRTRAALLRSAGLGERRLQRLLPFLVPLE